MAATILARRATGFASPAPSPERQAVLDSLEAAKLRDIIATHREHLAAARDKWGCVNTCMALAAAQERLAQAYGRLGIDRLEAVRRSQA